MFTEVEVSKRRDGAGMGDWVANLMNGGANQILKRALERKDTLDSFESSILSP